MINQKIISQFEEELFGGKDPKVYDYEKKYGPLDKETHDILMLMRAMSQHAAEQAVPDSFKAEKRAFLERVIRADQAAEAGQLSLGAYVAEQRQARRITVGWLAGQLGIDSAEYQRFEADRAILPSNILQQLVSILNIDSSKIDALKSASQPPVRLAWAARKKKKPTK
jgi:hypothetical protein